MRKGYRAEWELFRLLKKNYAVARVAGSGNPLTSCDLIAGNVKDKFAIEVKESKEEQKYVELSQIKQLINFSKKFGLKPVVAVKFKRKGWKFFYLEDLEKRKNFFVASFEKGRSHLK
jgi:Holliday junction resolvase